MTLKNSHAHLDEVQAVLRINDLEYLEMPGLNVMLAYDVYPEGHQGGGGHPKRSSRCDQRRPAAGADSGAVAAGVMATSFIRL